MSEMVTTISDAENDATTTIGGGGIRCEKGKEPHDAQGEAQVHNPQTRFADTLTRLGLHLFLPLCVDLFCFYITFFALVGRTKRRGPLLVLQQAQCAAVLCTIESVWHA